MNAGSSAPPGQVISEREAWRVEVGGGVAHLGWEPQTFHDLILEVTFHRGYS